MWDVLMQTLEQFAENGNELSEPMAQLYVWLCLSLSLNAAMLLCWMLGVLHRLAQRMRRLFKTNRREIVVQVQRAPVRTAKTEERQVNVQKETKECAPVLPNRARWPPVKAKLPKQKKRKVARGRTAMYTPCFFAQMPHWNNEEEML